MGVILAKLAVLEESLHAAEKKKTDLTTQVGDCKAKLSRATQLMEGLGGERVRWGELSNSLALLYENVVGGRFTSCRLILLNLDHLEVEIMRLMLILLNALDILLSSGVIAYLGSFPAAYRNTATETWRQALEAIEIPVSAPYSLTATLGEPVLIRHWVRHIRMYSLNGHFK